MDLIIRSQSEFFSTYETVHIFKKMFSGLLNASYTYVTIVKTTDRDFLYE